MSNSQPKQDTQSASGPSFAEAAAYWIKLGFISFGGPAGQIAMMQTECVDNRRWIGQAAFLRGLNYAMMLPGPEAQQLAAYIGWRLHGIKGALFAGTMFVVPGLILMIALAWLAAGYGDQGVVAAVFDGIKPVVVAIVIGAVWRIGVRTCKGPVPVALALGAFAALQFAGIPFPAVVLGAAVIGVAVARIMPEALSGGRDHDEEFQRGDHAGPGALGRFLRVTLIFTLLWAVPSALVLWLFGTQPYLDVIELFTTAAFVTFGGAYAVLPYVADAGVNTFGWLSGEQMIDGLALAETTPGPLILVTVYVGFFAGWAESGPMGVVTALLTAYVTFLPSLYLIVAGAPHVESIQRFGWARNALAAITAAVVGVILNLGVFLGQAALIGAGGGVQWTAAIVCVIAFALLLSGRIGIPALVGLGAIWGLLRYFVL